MTDDMARKITQTTGRWSVDQVKNIPWYEIRDALVISGNEWLADKFLKERSQGLEISIASVGDFRVGDRVRDDEMPAQSRNAKVVEVGSDYVVVDDGFGMKIKYRADELGSLKKFETVEMSVYRAGDRVRLPEGGAWVVISDEGAGRFKVDNVNDHGLTRIVSLPADGSAKMGTPVVSYDRSARCPYCSKTVAMSRGALGPHRAPGGLCDGAGRAVDRLEAGRAVFTISMDHLKLHQSVRLVADPANAWLVIEVLGGDRYRIQNVHGHEKVVAGSALIADTRG